jgi:hypothetical protein
MGLKCAKDWSWWEKESHSTKSLSSRTIRTFLNTLFGRPIQQPPCYQQRHYSGTLRMIPPAAQRFGAVGV